MDRGLVPCLYGPTPEVILDARAEGEEYDLVPDVNVNLLKRPFYIVHRKLCAMCHMFLEGESPIRACNRGRSGRRRG